MSEGNASNEFKIEQILKDSKILITHDNITIECNSTIKKKEETITFRREFDQDELDSILFTIKHISNKKNTRFPEFRERYSIAQKIQKNLKGLYYFGFLNLKYEGNFEENQLNTFSINSKMNLDSVKREFQDKEIKFNTFNDDKIEAPTLPLFFSIKNIYYLAKNFCSDNLKKIIQNLFTSGFKQYLSNFSDCNNSYLKTIILLNEILSMNEKLGDKLLSVDFYDGKLANEISNIVDFFKTQTIHFIKVSMPAHCYHVLFPFAVKFIHNELLFFQILYCNKTTKIQQYLSDFRKNKFVDNCIIIHPEFLNAKEYEAFKEEIKYETNSIKQKTEVIDMKKILVITSHDFVNSDSYYSSVLSDEIITSGRLMTNAYIKKTYNGTNFKLSNFGENKNM